jgi:hypothetical protein
VRIVAGVCWRPSAKQSRAYGGSGRSAKRVLSDGAERHRNEIQAADNAIAACGRDLLSGQSLAAREAISCPINTLSARVGVRGDKRVLSFLIPAEARCGVVWWDFGNLLGPRFSKFLMPPRNTCHTCGPG